MTVRDSRTPRYLALEDTFAAHNYQPLDVVIVEKQRPDEGVGSGEGCRYVLLAALNISIGEDAHFDVCCDGLRTFLVQRAVKALEAADEDDLSRTGGWAFCIGGGLRRSCREVSSSPPRGRGRHQAPG